MKLTSITVTDGTCIDAEFEVEGETDILIVEAEAGVAGLPAQIGHAYWKGSGDDALRVAAEHASDILRLIQEMISEPVEV